MSDNGPQFVSNEMKKFADTNGFTLLTTKRTIQTIKELLQDSPT